MARPGTRPAGSVAGASVSDAAAATNIKLMDAMLSRVDAMQTDLKTTMDNIVSANRSYQQTSDVGSIATKLDVGSDESQAAGIVLDAGNKRSYDNAIAYQAYRFADRDRVHFDNMQALIAVSFGNVVAVTAMGQNLAVLDAHQQCGENSVRRHK